MNEPFGQPVSRIVAFPRENQVYVSCLYSALEQQGMPAIAGVWSGRWLLNNLQRSDLVHIHWPSFCYYKPGDSRWRTWSSFLKFAIFLVLIRLRSAGIVWTAHNLYPHDGGRALLVHRLGRWLMVRMSKLIYVHGSSSAAIVQQSLKVPARKLVIGHHPHWQGYYADQCSRAEAREHLKVPQDAYIYLFIGICKPYKGIDNLLRTFAAIPGEDEMLVIAGHFQSEAYLRLIRELADKDPRVRLYPRFIADEELQFFLNAADSVVLAYTEILTSGAAMLALTFGRPVIAPRLGALVDHVDDACGVLYDPNDPKALPTALQDVRSKTFDAAVIKERVARFSWSAAAEALLLRVNGQGRQGRAMPVRNSATEADA